jgi:hypothetical protein
MAWHGRLCPRPLKTRRFVTSQTMSAYPSTLVRLHQADLVRKQANRHTHVHTHTRTHNGKNRKDNTQTTLAFYEGSLNSLDPDASSASAASCQSSDLEPDCPSSGHA